VEQKRRYPRYACSNKALVQIDNVVIVEANIVNISLNGALFELADDCIFQKGDKWQLTFKLPNSDLVLKFETEVVHSHANRVGVKFVHMDIDTTTNLHRLLETRPANSQRMAKSFAFMS